MQLVHVFATAQCFSSRADLVKFVMPTYTPDGDEIPSRFAREIGLSQFEPACIECVVSDSPKPPADLVSGASDGASWLHQLPAQGSFRAAVCIFSPNTVATPAKGPFQYLGACAFERRD